jgi:hypothetical protein
MSGGRGNLRFILLRSEAAQDRRIWDLGKGLPALRTPAERYDESWTLQS